MRRRIFGTALTAVLAVGTSIASAQDLLERAEAGDRSSAPRAVDSSERLVTIDVEQHFVEVRAAQDREAAVGR